VYRSTTVICRRNRAHFHRSHRHRADQTTLRRAHLSPVGRPAGRASTPRAVHGAAAAGPDQTTTRYDGSVGLSPNLHQYRLATVCFAASTIFMPAGGRAGDSQREINGHLLRNTPPPGTTPPWLAPRQSTRLSATDLPSNRRPPLLPQQPSP